MDFNVSQLLKEPVGSVRSYDLDESISLKTGGPKSYVKGSVNMLRTNRGILLTALLDSVVPCSCSRCLVDMGYPLELDIEEEYLPKTDVLTRARMKDPQEFEENFFTGSGHILDLSEAVRQYLDIGTPMNPICSDNCSGICLTCGVNLNETSCACDETPADPRWGPLLELVSVKEQDVN